METGPDQTLGHSLWYSQSAPEPASTTGKSQTLYRNRNEKIEKWKPKTRFGLYQIWKHIVETRNLLKLKNRNLKRQVRLSTTKHVDVSSSPPGPLPLPPQSGCLDSSPGNFLQCTPCSFPTGQSNSKVRCLRSGD